MISINQVTLVGKIASEFYNAGSTTKFTVETNESFIGQDGQRGNRKSFVKCIAWGKTAEALKLNCKQGDLVCVEGYVKPGNYEKDGRKVYTQDIGCKTVHFNAGEDAKQVGPKNVFPESSPAAMMDDLSF